MDDNIFCHHSYYQSSPIWVRGHKPDVPGAVVVVVVLQEVTYSDFYKSVPREYYCKYCPVQTPQSGKFATVQLTGAGFAGDFPRMLTITCLNDLISNHAVVSFSPQ